MEIIGIWPVSSAGNAVARFHVQMPKGIRLYNLKLSRKSDGTLRVFAPSAFGSSTATFTAETAGEMARLALAAMGDIAAHDRHTTQ